MTLLTRTATLLRVSFFVLTSALLIMHATAQQAVDFEGVEFDCRSAKTVSHELGVSFSTALFKGRGCICADTAEEAKKRIRMYSSYHSNLGTEYLGDDAYTHTKYLQVEEGKTTTATIYCYEQSVIDSLNNRGAQ